MSAALIIREGNCKSSLFISKTNTVKAHERCLKDRLAKVTQMLDTDVNSDGILFKTLVESEQSEDYKRMAELEKDIKQALVAIEKIKAKSPLARIREINADN